MSETAQFVHAMYLHCAHLVPTMWENVTLSQHLNILQKLLKLNYWLKLVICALYLQIYLLLKYISHHEKAVFSFPILVLLPVGTFFFSLSISLLVVICWSSAILSIYLLCFPIYLSSSSTCLYFLLSPFLMPTFFFVLQRATGVLSTVLPQSSEAVQHVIQGDVVRTMRRLLKVHNCTYDQVSVNTSTLCILLVKW